MAGDVKTDDNTPVEDINTITNPNTKTLIDRYVFASNFCKGKRVLDCACGHGYGMYIMKGLGAKKVTGFDIDEDAIVEIQNRNELNDAYLVDATSDWSQGPGVCKDKYDVIVSIETFEHISRDKVKTMLTNFKNVCSKGGKIIITTPHRYEPVFEYKGGTHLYEYNVTEFIEELEKVFKSKSIELWYAVEFTHPFSQELNTVFSKEAAHSDYAPVMLAVITND